MKWLRFLVRIAVSTIIVTTFLVSCGGRSMKTDAAEGKPKAVRKVESSSEFVSVPETTEALIIFKTGLATVIGPSGERYPEIGDTVLSGESVITGPDGYIELQFGNFGAIHISENTKYILDTVALSGSGGRASGTLAAGSVISKVKKLGKDDAFEINVPGAVCAVRGTKFLVRTDELGSTTIAVIEGSVSVVPPSFSKAASSPADDAALSAIKALMPLVTADEEIMLTKDSFLEVEAEFIVWKESTTPSEKSDAAETMTVGLQKAISGAPAATAIKDENATIIREVTTELLNLPSINDSGAEMTPTLATLTVRTEASDTRIYLNNRSVGRGNVSRIFQEGTPVEIRAVAADGRTLERNVLAGSEPVVKMEFEVSEIQELPSDEVIEATEEPVSLKSIAVAEDVPVILQIRVRPENAVIMINGSRRGQATARVEGREGEPMNLRIESQGYAAYEKRIVINPDSPTIDITLEPRININRIQLPGRGVGTPAGNNRFAVLATIDGNLLALNIKGEPIWIRETENRDGENLSPVIIGNRVYAIGGKELVAMDLASGRVLYRHELSGGFEDRFGRRPVAIANRVVIPGDAVLQFINPETGVEQGVMEIPQGSRSTPTPWNRHLLIADQRGTLHFINPENLSIDKSVPTPSEQPIGQAPAIGNADLAVIVGRKGTVSAVNLSEGTLAWERPLAGGETIRVYTDAVIAGDIAYIYGEGRLYALGMSNGRDRFNPVGGVTAPPMLRGNILILCRDNGTLTLHDRKNGNLLGEIPMGEIVQARPVGLGDYIVAAGEQTAFVFDPRSIIY